MPLAGGASEKFGNRYEGRWTVACLLDIMEERAESIRLEPPVPEEQGFEFWTTKQGIREYHQVKRQHYTGQWTLHTLAGDGVLANFITKLEDPSVRCVFVSTNSAGQLNELSDRATRSSSWEEFAATFLSDNQSRKNFDLVRSITPGVPEQDAYERLKRILVEPIGENFLLAAIESRVSALVDGDAATIVDVLAEMVSERVHHELTAHDIWNHLESRGFSRRHWDNDPHVLSAVEEANGRYLSLLRRQAIDGTFLPRLETQTVQGRLKESGGKDGVLVTGEAGIGKSGVMLQVVEELLDAGAPALAFRADRLEPTQLPDDVGKQIGLPGSPASVLAAVAQGTYCVLLIDQLDALSLASGRNTQLYDCVYEILLQAQAHPNMRILLACRKFDLDNDYRLRQLTEPNGVAEAVVVERLSHETVREVVVKFGLDADSLNFKQLDLLSVPLHLKLLSELLADAEIRRLNFETAQDLYERFWEFKQQVIRERLGHPVQWTQVVYLLCDYMHERETLSAPEIVVDDWNNDANAMVSENVLVFENKRYSFFHEGFFDYAFARRFAGGSQSLLGLLVSGEQRLFRRAQVRQILLYLRETDFDRYIAEATEVLSSSDARFHIKQLIFAMLADLTEPVGAEWDMLSRFAGKDFSDPVTRQAWVTVRRPSWFRLVDQLGLVQQWFNDPNNAFVDQTALLLRVIQRDLPDRVAELVEPFVGKSESWNDRLAHLAVWGDWSQGRRFLELMLRLIDEGILDDAKGPIAVNSDFWSLVYRLQYTHPSWGCEVAGHFFNRRRQLSLRSGQPNPFDHLSGSIRDSQLAEGILSKLAKDAPDSFIREVLPFLQEVLEECASKEPGELLQDPIWSYRIFQSWYGIDHTLLNSMVIALSELAIQHPDMYRSVIGPLLGSPFETIQYLVIRSLASNGLHFADEGIEQLCRSPECLRIGYSSHPHWAARQLIEAVTPHSSNEKLKELEILLLDYYTDWERSESGGQQYGYAQFTLLSGIVSNRRSEEVSARLEELQQKFGGRDPAPPVPMRAQRVQSPIPPESVKDMSDEEWLWAISQHDADKREFTQDGRFVGGAAELSQDLEERVKQDPERFGELVLKFPDDANRLYFEAVLRGINGTGLSIDTIVRVCERCHGIEGRPVGRFICDPIASSAKEELPQEMLNLVAWYATEDPDPSEELWRVQPSPGQEYYYRGDPSENGINTNRGRAAHAMASLIEADGSRVPHFLSALERMVKDPSTAVRSCVAQTLIAVLRHDRDLAVKLFQQLCDSEDGLLQTRFIERFLFFALQTHFQELSNILERMVTSSVPDVASVGGRQACLAALDLEDAADLAELCLSGSEAQKIGAAQVMAANVGTATCRSYCEDALSLLFSDPSNAVRAEAADCFRRFQGSELEGYDDLISRFVSSDAFASNNFPLLVALERTTAKLPEVTLLACERFMDIVGLAAGDIRTSEAGDANTVVKLTLRTYQQCSDGAIRARSLDLVDKLMQSGAYGIHDALEEFER